jgi:serine/threonine protein kinase
MNQRDASDENFAPRERRERVSLLVYEFLSRRRQGDPTEPADFEKTHPDLMPELHEALARGLRQLRHVADSERAHGESTPPAPVIQPVDSSKPRPMIRNYRLLREISAGGQGTVFEAIQEATGRTVAVKVVAWVSRNSAARFEREVQALVRLSHPCIVSVIDRGRTADDAYYMVMDYVKGMDLNEWVSSQRHAPDGRRQILTMFAKIASGINAAHERGIIHRDLKPSNVRVDEYGQPRIVDFGLAHLLNENEAASSRQLTVTGNIVGSVPWASPEQAAVRADKFCPATDVYSLGVLLYESLAGRPPYPVDGPLHVVTKNICERDPADPANLKDAPFGRIDERLSHILLKCLAKETEQRFVSGGEFAEALQRYLAGRYTLPRRSPPRWQRLARVAVLAVIPLIGWPVYRSMNSDSVRVVDLPTFQNGFRMKFVQMKPDRFRMGSEINEQGRTDWEQAHTVRITYPFYLAETEATRAQYLAVMGVLPPGVEQENLDLPVDHVSWDDAMVFCRKMGEKDHRAYRLPTEAEWEFACRAGSRDAFAGSGRLDSIGWYEKNSLHQIHPVGLKSPNRWGLYDMHGNVAEWVFDQFVPLLGPDDATDPIHELGNDGRSIRGGSAFDGESACRSASRTSDLSGAARAGVGFRVAIGPLPHSH